MRCIWHVFFVVLVLHGVDAPAQQPVDDSRTPRQVLRDFSWVYNWPGGDLFHTAFHRGYTTRFLLLKNCTSSPVIADYLELTENQLKSIRELNPVVSSELQSAQPDEQVVDADYYAFLSKHQLLKLDITALRFDGFWALTRQSLAGSAKLSDDSKSKVAAVVADVRDRIVLPKFRWAFAAPLPPDYYYEQTHFEGSVATYVNIRIVNLLTDEECNRLRQLLKDHPIPRNIESELRKLSTLPQGVVSLYIGVGEKEP